MAHPLVVNRHLTDNFDVYVGRPTKWGNPWRAGEENEDVTGRKLTKAEAIRLYAQWLLTHPELLACIRSELKGKILACSCAPSSCHADILARLANERVEVGFTGTQRGMTIFQIATVRRLLANADVLHHGDCIGADADAHDIAVSSGLDIVLHPPNVDRKRALCQAEGMVVRKPRPYLVRNEEIVRETSWLIATPGEVEEQLRSGTWATVRHARSLGRPLSLVAPDGSLIDDETK